MIDQETVWTDIWIVVEQLINATLNENESKAKRLLAPRRPAADILDLHGLTAFDILLKTVLNKPQVSLIGAIESDGGKFVHLEYAWLDPDATQVVATDVVTITLKKYHSKWRITDINPAPIATPLNEPRAQMVLATAKTDRGEIPSEAWILPYTLYAGALLLPLRPEALIDNVEALLLPGLQQRTHGIFSLVLGRKMWRDFKKKSKLKSIEPSLYAASVEYILSELAGRKISPATVAKFYQLPMIKVSATVKQIKLGLKIKDNDRRYSPNAGTQIIIES